MTLFAVFHLCCCLWVPLLPKSKTTALKCICGVPSLCPVPPGLLAAFRLTKNSEISGTKLNGMVKTCFECTLFVGISRIVENFVFHSQRDVRFRLPTERPFSYNTVPCLPHSKGTAAFVFLTKLWAAQMNCQLDSVQCTLFLVSITDTRGVTIHVPVDSIWFRLLPFNFDYFDSIMQNINDF